MTKMPIGSLFVGLRPVRVVFFRLSSPGSIGGTPGKRRFDRMGLRPDLCSSRGFVKGVGEGYRWSYAYSFTYWCIETIALILRHIDPIKLT